MKRLGVTVTGAMANLAAQGIPFLLLLVVTPILLRSLGREQYGALVLFNLLPQIAGQLDLGLSTAATRGFTQRTARADASGARRIFGEALLLLVGWGFVLDVAFFAFRDAIADVLKLDTVVADGSAIYLASALSIPLSLANSAVLVPLRALERYAAIARVQVVAGVAYWAIASWWAQRGGTLTQLVFLGALSIAASTAALYGVGRRPGASTRMHEADATGITATAADLAPVDEAPAGGLRLRPYLRVGAGAFVAQASSLATYHADKLLVSALVAPAAAGAYAICTSVANKLLLVVASGATYTFPRAARLHAEGAGERVAETYAFSTRVSLLIATGLAVPLVALAPSFLEIWIGPSFADEFAGAFRLLAIGYAITASSVVASNVAVGVGEVALPGAFALIGGVVTLAAVAALTPRYGATGAAAAAVIGMSQSLVFNDFVARRLGGSARRASWPLVARLALVAVPLTAAGTTLAPLARGWLSLFGCGAVIVIAFATVWLATFGRVDERRLLEHLVARVRDVPRAG